MVSLSDNNLQERIVNAMGNDGNVNHMDDDDVVVAATVCDDRGNGIVYGYDSPCARLKMAQCNWCSIDHYGYNVTL